MGNSLKEPIVDVKYCLPEAISSTYAIDRITMKCRNCSYEFKFLEAGGMGGYAIIKYQEVNGEEIRWLPTYGKGGYLYLMQKLLPDFRIENEITQQIAEEFNELLKAYTEPSTRGNLFALARFPKECPSCNSKELATLEEEILDSSDATWMKIDCSLLEE